MPDSINHTIDYCIRQLVQRAHNTAIEKGWYVSPIDGTPVKRNPLELIALMHSELSESIEAFRHDNPRDEHCPDFGNAEIEFADTIIRIFDACGYLGLDIAGALLAKMEYNETRPVRHGGKVY